MSIYFPFHFGKEKQIQNTGINKCLSFTSGTFKVPDLHNLFNDPDC